MDQHCESPGGVAGCVNNTCLMLACTALEVCITTPGGGAYCQDNTCTMDGQCTASQHCNGTICVDDVCTPGALECTVNAVEQCNAAGSGLQTVFVCDAPSTGCVEPTAGQANCACLDDWDCPLNTVCTGGLCQGDGTPPVVTPTPLANMMPALVFQWGGTGVGAAQSQAVNAPFPLSSQVGTTPLVANLDDDNNDGVVDDRDIPEILFMTYCGSDIATNGIVRAIHGGGPNAGRDYFATCGTTVWHEGDPLDMSCACSAATANSTATLAVADLDGDGHAEIVVPNETSGLTILDHTGVPITNTAPAQWTGYPNPAPAVANMDAQGMPEIVVGRYVFTLGLDVNNALTFVDRFAGNLMSGLQGQGPISCVAALAGRPTPDLVAGTTLYEMPVPPPGVTRMADCAPGDTSAFCLGQLDVVWDGQTVNGNVSIPNGQRDGFCAVVDVLGGDQLSAPGPLNPLDGVPEVILINEGYLVILNSQTGARLRFINLGAGTDGGAPTVADLDGDGFPEIAAAFGVTFRVVDLQDPSTECPAWPNAFADGVMGLQGNPPRTPGGTCTNDGDCAVGAVCQPVTGTCVCQHNGWSRVTEDDSSRVTASVAFDFNSDGALDVAYGDECFLRIYEGISGQVAHKSNAPNRTRIERPVLADVDADGRANIVHVANNDAASCSAGVNHPNGIYVWADTSNTWPGARSVDNQHTHHWTNITESLAVPTVELPSWTVTNGRGINGYHAVPALH